MSQSYNFLVGTFNTPHLYTLRFTPPSLNHSPATLAVIYCASAIGSHSWLHLLSRRNGVRNLYATAWTEPPSVVAYAIHSNKFITLLGSAPTRSRSGYVTASEKALYSAGGATGEVFSLDPRTGNVISPKSSADAAASKKDVSSDVIPLQNLSFLDENSQRDDGSVMDFGGLRHGAHSTDLSPDGKALYIADIGRNCIWTFSVDQTTGELTLGEKHISPRPSDGPRHVTPHPSGNYVYCLQEHTSMVDVFSTSNEGVKLKHEQGVRIIPSEEREGDYWADEVRVSLSNGEKPRWLYASTRNLKEGKKGWVAVYKLDEDGKIDTPVTPNSSFSREGDSKSADQTPYKGLLYLWETPTSGGWANAIQPGPTVDGVEYLAMTDSEEGFVFVLSWDGKEIKEVARTKLDEGAGAATAVWL